MKEYKLQDYENNKEIVQTNLDGFFSELFALYKKYNISISHQDGHGGFILEKDCEENREWIEDAEVYQFLTGKREGFSTQVRNNND